MKNLFLLIISIFAITEASAAFAQDKVLIPFDSATGKYAYVKLIEVPSTNAGVLYQRGKEWCKQKFTDDKFLIDEQGSKFADLGNFPITVKMKGLMFAWQYTVTYTLTAQFKDGKSKLEITNIKLTKNAQGTTEEQVLESVQKQLELSGVGKGMAKSFFENCCAEVDSEIKKVIAQFETGLKTDAGKSDW